MNNLYLCCISWSLMASSFILAGCGNNDKSSASGAGKKASPEEQVRAVLQIENNDNAREICRLLESACWKQHGISMNERDRRHIKQAMKKVGNKEKLTTQDAQQLMADAEARIAAERKREADDEAKGIIHLPPSESIETALAIFRKEKPQLGEYEAKSLIAKAMLTSWPEGYSKVNFRPRSTLVRPDDCPSAPPVGKRYEHLLKIKQDYWNDKVYLELKKMPSNSLPDGAMLPVLHLTTISDAGLRRDDYNGELTYDSIIKAYGPRLYPALVEFMVNPEAYGLKSSTPPAHMLRFAREWPVDLKKKLLEAALKSGWNDTARLLEMGPEKAEILVRFVDSPYGKPE